jgi:hypothetical protein
MPCALPQNSPPPPRARGSISTSFAEDAASSPSPCERWESEWTDDALPSDWFTSPVRRRPALGHSSNLMVDAKQPFRPAPRHLFPSSSITLRKTPPPSPSHATYRDFGLNPSSIVANHRAVLRNTPSRRSRNGQKPKVCAKDEYCEQILSSKGGGSSGSGGCMAIHVVDGVICVAQADRSINLWSLRTCQFLSELVNEFY